MLLLLLLLLRCSLCSIPRAREPRRRRGGAAAAAPASSSAGRRGAADVLLCGLEPLLCSPVLLDSRVELINMGGCCSKGHGAPTGGGYNQGGGGAVVFVPGGPTPGQFGSTPSGVWDKQTCFNNIRRAAGRSKFDMGNESEGGRRVWMCPNSKFVNVWNNDIQLLSMRTAPSTIYLDVSNNDIKTLTTLEGGQSLVYFDASSNDIGHGSTGGMPHPGTLVMPCLEGVNLANNDIGPHIPVRSRAFQAAFHPLLSAQSPVSRCVVL
jgi:hypothetical protein